MLVAGTLLFFRVYKLSNQAHGYETHFTHSTLQGQLPSRLRSNEFDWMYAGLRSISVYTQLYNQLVVVKSQASNAFHISSK